ncbi:hypothetical protein [Arthrobacter sp.]|uniref:hypothetical protein n=1 Tax=Arthrobacter sp. TaxID=1667 RepID=UPI0033991EC1
MQRATHEHQTKVFDETQTFWKGLTRKEQTDPAAYTAALRKYTDAKHKELYASTQSRSLWSRPTNPAFTEEFIDDVEWRLGLPRSGKPARVLKADLPFPINRTTSFPAGEGKVRFDKDTNTVHWDTGQNRDAIDKARNSVAVTALFNRIKTVKWTRNTGGVFMGNNENAAEEGVPDRCHVAYGPIGAAQEPSSCEEYTASKGNRVTQRDFTRLQQELWDAQRKLRNRMAKATAAAGRRPRQDDRRV